eukprot:UN19793
MVNQTTLSKKHFDRKSVYCISLPWVSNYSTSPEPHLVPGCGVIDFILPVSLMRLCLLLWICAN